MSGDVQTLVMRNDPAEMERLVAFIDAFCEPLNASVRDGMALQLSLEEAVMNVIHHGYSDGLPHEFTVELGVHSGDCLRAVVTDDAPAYDPLARPEFDTTAALEDRQIGGLGVHLMKKLMERAHYERRDGRNILTLERTLTRLP